MVIVSLRNIWFLNCAILSKDVTIFYLYMRCLMSQKHCSRKKPKVLIYLVNVQMADISNQEKMFDPYFGIETPFSLQKFLPIVKIGKRESSNQIEIWTERIKQRD